MEDAAALGAQPGVIDGLGDPAEHAVVEAHIDGPPNIGTLGKRSLALLDAYLAKEPCEGGRFCETDREPLFPLHNVR